MENPGTEPLPPHPPPMMPATTTAAQNVTYVVYQMAAPTAAVQPKMDWSSCCSFYFARTMLTFFLWASWVVYIAGASKNQQICQGGGMFNAAGEINAPFPDVVALNAIATNNVPNNASSCVYYFSLLWWSIWLQFTTVLMVTATTFQIFARFPGVKGIFTIALYFAIMSSVLMFVQANIYNNATYVNINKVAFPNNDWTISCTLCLVGTITSLIFNFIYLIWNSWTDVPKVAGIPTAMPTPTVNAHIAPEAAKATAV